jgi:hypothetical protein
MAISEPGLSSLLTGQRTSAQADGHSGNRSLASSSCIECGQCTRPGSCFFVCSYLYILFSSRSLHLLCLFSFHLHFLFLFSASFQCLIPSLALRFLSLSDLLPFHKSSPFVFCFLSLSYFLFQFTLFLPLFMQFIFISITICAFIFFPT